MSLSLPVCEMGLQQDLPRRVVMGIKSDGERMRLALGTVLPTSEH